MYGQLTAAACRVTALLQVPATSNPTSYIYINTASLNDDTESLLVRWHVQRTQNRPCVCVIAASQYCHVKSEQQHHDVFKDRHQLHAHVVRACVPSSPRETVLRPPSSVQSSRPAGRCTAPCKCVHSSAACVYGVHTCIHAWMLDLAGHLLGCAYI